MRVPSARMRRARSPQANADALASSRRTMPTRWGGARGIPRTPPCSDSKRPESIRCGPGSFTVPPPRVEIRGIRRASFVYVAAGPIEPEKSPGGPERQMPGVIRPRRHFWIADAVRNGSPEFSSLATVLGQAARTWWAAVPKEAGPSTRAPAPTIAQTERAHGATGGRKSVSSRRHRPGLH